MNMAVLIILIQSMHGITLTNVEFDSMESCEKFEVKVEEELYHRLHVPNAAIITHTAFCIEKQKD